MAIKCKSCGKKVIKFPFKDEEGNIIWINLFKMDLMSILGFIVIIILVISYKADTETCREIISDPLEYCEESNACKIIEERKTGSPYGVDIDIPEFNNTKW